MSRFYGGLLLCAFGLEAERLRFPVGERWGTDQDGEKISEVAGEENRRFLASARSRFFIETLSITDGPAPFLK